jgi:hypothetical protein
MVTTEDAGSTFFHNVIIHKAFKPRTQTFTVALLQNRFFEVNLRKERAVQLGYR